MRHPLAKSSRLWMVLILPVLLMTMAAHALEVDDPEYGFRFSMPDRLFREPKSKDPDVLYEFKGLPKEIGGLGSYVEIKALKGPIMVGARADPSKIQVDPGFNLGFDQIEWQTHKLEVIIMRATDPERANVEIYTTIFPLAGRSIRLRVAGLSNADEPARALFDRTVASFVNTKPLQMEREESAAYKLGGLVAKVVIWGLIAFVFIRMIVRMAKGKPKTPKGRPPQAGPPMIRRPR